MATVKSRTRWQSIALPAAHGGWGLTLEPIILGLLVAPSWAGLLLGISALAAFLVHQPFKVFATEWQRGKHSPRRQLAGRYTLAVGTIALLGFVAAYALVGFRPLLPMLFAVPPVLFYLFNDLRRQGRSWQAEFSASLVFPAVATSIALADQWSLAPALALWAVMAARALPSIMYVRARLRLEKGKPADTGWVIAAHVLALVLVLGLVWLTYLPALALAALLTLLLRATLCLSRYRRPLTTKAIGFIELGLGALTVLAVYLGAILTL